ncbi:MAG: hypothetical protein F8N37_24615 [Telmatospirillum sp.]|nr:hypothetical protein [Telmatospirillum sp.]
MTPTRKRSIVVNLSIVGLTGSALLGAILSSGSEVRRNLYRSQADCERDYSPAQCEADRFNDSRAGGPVHGGGGGGGGWRGPAYAADRSAPDAGVDPGPGRQGLASGTESSVRGGFGRIGSFFRAVG